VLVKRLEGGVFGVLAHSRLRPGDLLETLPPLGRFTVPIDPSHRKAYLALASGSGIAPVMSLLRSLLGREPGSRFTLLYGNRGAGSVIFAEALAGLKDRYVDRFQLLHFFSQEQQDIPLLNGRLTTEKLQALTERLLDIAAYDEVFVCGPEPMTLDLRSALLGLGVPKGRLHLELFGSHGTPQPHPHAPASDGRSVRLEVTLGGVRRIIQANPDDTVLDAAAGAGLDVPFSCTGGVCATCRARLLRGTVEMAANYALQPWEIEAGFVLTCQSRPTADDVAIDYDAV
jgi:ring-1,2-phenylacetyl-CoA epoxidase subunit PaaE